MVYAAARFDKATTTRHRTRTSMNMKTRAVLGLINRLKIVKVLGTLRKTNKSTASAATTSTEPTTDRRMMADLFPKSVTTA